MDGLASLVYVIERCFNLDSLASLHLQLLKGLSPLVCGVVGITELLRNTGVGHLVLKRSGILPCPRMESVTFLVVQPGQDLEGRTGDTGYFGRSLLVRD